MAAELNSSGIALHSIDDCLIVPVRSEINDNYLSQLTGRLSGKHRRLALKVLSSTSLRSGFLEAFHFSLLADMAKMVALLGAKAIFVGFQAGVAAALIDLEVNINNINTMVTMADGLAALASVKADRREFEENREMEAGAVDDDPGESRGNDPANICKDIDFQHHDPSDNAQVVYATKSCGGAVGFC